MKLTYRGVAYETHNLTVPMTTTGIAATYRNQTYLIQQPAFNRSIQHPTGITYRLSSGFCFNGLFLGRRYRHCASVLEPVSAAG